MIITLSGIRFAMVFQRSDSVRRVLRHSMFYWVFLHTSPEVSTNISLIESISIFLHPSPAVSISVS